MELYFLASAVKHKLDFFETQMQTLRFPLKFKDEKGKEKIQILYGMLQPMKLYRYIFPKESLNCVLNTLNLGENRYPMFDKQGFVLRKALNAKKIPKPDLKVPPILINTENVAIKGIGIKEDVEMTFPNGLTHEAI